jgi:nucleoside-diphosphate-sugar epimerase
MTVLPVPKPPGMAAVPPLAVGKKVSMILWPVTRGVSVASLNFMGLAFRTGQVCRRVSSFSSPSALRIFATRLLSEHAPICYEDGQQLRDYVSVHDVARANLLVMQDPRANYQVFNVGGGRAISVVDFARLVAHRVDVNIAPEIHGQFRFGDTRHIVSDISKLRALGWEPAHNFEEALQKTVKWYVENEWWWRKLKSGAYSEYYKKQYVERR